MSRVSTDAARYGEHDSCASNLVLFEAFDVRSEERKLVRWAKRMISHTVYGRQMPVCKTIRCSMYNCTR